MGLYELNKKFNIARQIGFIFNQINDLIRNFFSHQRYINICCCSKFPIPKIHGQFFKLISQIPEDLKKLQ